MPEAEELLVALGEVVRQMRFEQRISQEEIERRVGLHRNYAGGIERAERNPSLVAVARIAEALGVKPSELLARAGY